MNKYIVILGLNDKNTKRQEINTLDAYKIVNNVILRHTEGATIREANGIYTHENGQVVIEKSLVIELLFTEDETVKKIADELKLLLNQESVVIQKQKIESELY